ncbi:hypothetical protein NDU88_006623 [Pleurodeles waltl]|uniref:Uncharacterized protein n=1 Tax=Pleurodeles waltl TaxID=8319 RepID=A0AAV7SQC3_PLEWA|nr:hypothetical protein NDU88_006623 [Pleurodeles waltl]
MGKRGRNKAALPSLARTGQSLPKQGALAGMLQRRLVSRERESSALRTERRGDCRAGRGAAGVTKQWSESR